MNKKPTYEELQKKINLLEFQLSQQKKSRQDIVKDKYYLDQAQKIGKLSTWEYDVENETIFWTPQNYKTFGVKVHSPELFLKSEGDSNARTKGPFFWMRSASCRFLPR